MREYLHELHIETIVSALKNLINARDKISYIISIKAKYIQLPLDDKLDYHEGYIDRSFIDWCDVEIDKIKELEVMDQYLSQSENDIIQLGKTELHNLSQQIVLFHELGIFEFLRGKYKIHSDDHTTMAKLYCQIIMDYDKNTFGTKATNIKNLKKNPDKIISKIALKKVSSILSELNLSQPD